MAVRTDTSKRESLLDIACQLFLERGYDDVSMQQIAEAAGVTKAAPYYHFKNKDDLFARVYLREMGRITDGVLAQLRQDGPFRERIYRALLGLVIESKSPVARFFSEFERFVSLEVDADLQRELFEQVDVATVMLPYFVEAHARGEFTAVLPERANFLFLLIVMGHFQWMTVPKFNPTFDLPSEELARELTDLFFNGIA